MEKHGFKPATVNGNHAQRGHVVLSVETLGDCLTPIRADINIVHVSTSVQGLFKTCVLYRCCLTAYVIVKMCQKLRQEKMAIETGTLKSHVCVT